MDILVPKHYLDLSVRHARSGGSDPYPIIFLAGPVRGGGDWQAKMALLIEQDERLRDALVIVPCRWNATLRLATRFRNGSLARFDRQLEWERYYLEWAGVKAKLGCIIFWLAEESKERPHPGPEPYGMDTRGELGEWRMRMKYQNARVVVGAEPGFHGLSQIQRNFSAVLGYNFPILSSMEEVVRAAGRVAMRD